jgi:hypothetical protein
MNVRSRGIKSSDNNLEEWLSLIPVRNCEYLEDNGGNFLLKMPRAKNIILFKLIETFLKSPFIEVKLDKRGTFIWKQCDGKNSVEKICRELMKQFGEEVKPAEERTILFFKELYKNRLITFLKET